MAAARLSPRCVVENYLYADVGTLIAPGSTGKTTASLYEAVHITLGLPLWGLEVVTPGPVLIVTAEDRREFLVARLREICATLRLSAAQMERVCEGIRIDDRTASIMKLTTIVCDIVTVAGFARQIVEGARDLAPVLVQFDPLVSFGVGESRVNDAEQGLIEAGRVISGGLDCAVRYVHHTGKAPALEKRADQYTGRGGSALADGCRMVHVMQALDAAELAKATDEGLAEGESAFALHRPKLSYGPPQRVPLYVRRRGFAFELLRAKAAQSADERAKTLGEQLARFIASELHDGRRHTRNSLREMRPESMSRGDVMTALAWLDASGRLVERELLDASGKRPATGARSYLDAPAIGGAMADR
jgi:RecA-family ATPase